MNSAFSLKRLFQLFAASSKLRIAVIGDLMLDTYITGSSSRLSQEAPVPVLHVRERSIRLGGAANVVRNLLALSPSAKISAFGVVGADESGQKLKSLLENANADVCGIVVDPGRPTIEKQRVIANGQQVVRMDFENTAPIPEKTRLRLMDKLSSMLKDNLLDAVIVEDYAKGLIGQEMLDHITSSARKYGVFTSLDPNPRNPVRSKGFSLMTPNRSEAFALAGIYCSDPVENVAEDNALRSVADNILSQWAPDHLLITLGPQGMALFSADAPVPFVIPTVAREVFDVSGAGDTVISAYTLYHAAGATDQEAAVISNQAAGIVVAKSGTATTDTAELTKSFAEAGCR